MSSSPPAPAPSPSPSPSPSTPSQTPPPNPIPDADNPTASLPLPMSASIILTSLPRDAKSALSSAAAADGNFDQRKVTIRFQPIGSAPILRTKVFKISASQRFDTVVAFLRRRLDLVGAGAGAAKGGGKGRAGPESVFCYVNSCFAPGGDEVVGNLWRCFKTDDQLIVAYAVTPAFG